MAFSQYLHFKGSRRHGGEPHCRLGNGRGHGLWILDEGWYPHQTLRPRCWTWHLLTQVIQWARCWSARHYSIWKKHQKDQIILALVWGILADFWVPHEIDSWNFQHMLDLWFSEASQNLNSFRQLLFSLFHRGDQREKFKKTMSNLGRDFEFFPVVPPFW